MFNQRSGRLAALSGRPVHLAVALRSRTWLLGTEGGGTTPPAGARVSAEVRGQSGSRSPAPRLRVGRGPCSQGSNTKANVSDNSSLEARCECSIIKMREAGKLDSRAVLCFSFSPSISMQARPQKLLIMYPARNVRSLLSDFCSRGT